MNFAIVILDTVLVFRNPSHDPELSVGRKTTTTRMKFVLLAKLRLHRELNETEKKKSIKNRASPQPSLKRFFRFESSLAFFACSTATNTGNERCLNNYTWACCVQNNFRLRRKREREKERQRKRERKNICNEWDGIKRTKKTQLRFLV